MNCPKCDEEMEFEELKNFHGVWICCECDKEYDGSYIPCDVEEDIDGTLHLSGWEESLS